MSTSQLLYAFKNQSRDYGYGFQAGQIWEKITSCEPFEFRFLANIEEEVLGMLKVRGVLFFAIETISDEWRNLVVHPTVVTENN